MNSPQKSDNPAASPSGQAAPIPGQLPGQEVVLYEGHPALVAGLGALLLSVLTLGLALIYFAIRRSSVSYKVTTQRIVVDRGIFSKKLDQVDLYRVNDFVVDRPFSQRIMGTGNIRIATLDKSSPEVVLTDVRGNVIELYEKIRNAAEAAKAVRGVRVIDYE